MPLKIEFKKYKKFEDVSFEFTNNVNIIAGENGTCKSTLLYIISNSFQGIEKKGDFFKKDKQDFIQNTKETINRINLKIEQLLKDSKYYDPAKGVKGGLYKVIYSNEKELSFRKYKNNPTYNQKFRPRIIPSYRKNKKESLEIKFVIYLGLSRLLPHNEDKYDNLFEKIDKDIPDKYKEEIQKLYYDFTKFKIDYNYSERISGIKNRVDFKTDIEGIDSNTISMGEDNLLIILKSIVTCKYYYDIVNEDYIHNEEIVSVLLIDEFDASLHPYYQNKLLDTLIEYSKKYKIQVVFTTHSFSLLEYALQNKENINIIYLTQSNNKVKIIDNLSIYNIKQHLFTINKNKMYHNKYINIFTEDDEARAFLNYLLDFLKKQNEKEFGFISNKFTLFDIQMGANNLKSIFKEKHFKNDKYIGICILDGDQNQSLDDCIITLPGKESPEKIFFTFVQNIYDKYEHYDSIYKISDYYSKNNLFDIFNKYIIALDEIKEKKERKESTKGLEREKLKNLFKENEENHKYFFDLWIQEHLTEVNKFYKNLNILFQKVADSFEMDKNDWKIEENEIKGKV